LISRPVALALTLLATLLALLGVPVSGAQAATTTDITVLQSEARVDFPRSMDFHVVAQSTGQVTEAHLAYRVANDNVIHIGRATFQPNARVDTHYLVDLQRAYYPPGVTIQYQWRLQDLTGAEVQTVWANLTLADPRYRWHQRAQGVIQLHWHDVDDAYANAVLNAANTTFTAGNSAVPAPGSPPINIFIYGRLADFRGILGAGSQEWVGGQTFPQYRVVLLLVSPTDVASAQRSVAHEMTHLQLDNVVEGTVAPLPTWLDEGLAMVAEGDTQPAFQQALDQAVRDHKLISIQSLSGNFPDASAAATVAYAESESMVRYFLKTYGREKIAALIANFRQGLSADEAFQQTIGMTARDFQTAWQASLGTAPQPVTPAADNSSGLARTIMAPVRAVIGFVNGLIQSLLAPKLKPA
jgi:hypothetical protein